MLPVFFIALASAALALALAALFASLRATFGSGRGTSWVAAGPDRGALEDEKHALLRALKDLEYEHEVGKIDDDDYARLERAYRARAKEVLGELDRDLGPYLSRAEDLVGGAAGESEKKRKKKAKKERSGVPVENAEGGANDGNTHVLDPAPQPPDAEPSASPSASPARPLCAKCATPNEADARFCKQCASALAATEAS